MAPSDLLEITFSKAKSCDLGVTHPSLTWPAGTDSCRLISAPASHSPTPLPHWLPLTRHQSPIWIKTYFSFTDSAGNAPSTWCTASLVYLLKPFQFWTEPAKYIRPRQSGWAWMLYAVPQLIGIHMPQGKTYVDMPYGALHGCFSSYKFALNMDYSGWMTLFVASC